MKVKKNKEEVDRGSGEKTILKSGQEWTWPTLLGQMKTGQGGEGLLQSYLIWFRIQ